ncbi:MAG TPA: acyl-CoA synthetase FdrA [Clostridiales bacterium]|nr:acyl-CoA synthetase FdrA [Clostridiales bacterium]
MIAKWLIKENSYYDSVTLMLITKEIEARDDVENAVVVMGTDLNKDLLNNVGLLNDETKNATPNDLIIAVRMKEDKFDEIVAKVEELLNKKKSDAGDDYNPPTLDSAIKYMPDSNMVVISLPGAYAADEARKALENDKHVMLFSDNVTIEQERELKELAVSKGLLMMGPDCGTAMINQVPLCFCNKVRKGNIGIVGASGTGTQEVMVQIDRLGGGCSQVIGTGGRDLKKEIGGLMMTLGIQALAADPETEVIVLVSKPPAYEIAEKVLKTLKEAGKKAVVCFIGGDDELVRKYGFIAANSLEDAAFKAVALAKGEEPKDAPLFEESEEIIDKMAAEERAKMSPKQKYLRGLFSGGTLCDEALKMFTKEFGGIYSNIALSEEYQLKDSKKSFEHTALDLGDDEFTRGRPHPMIDSYMRQQMILKEAEDEEVAVLLLDVVLGYGSNEDPAGSLVEHIKLAKKKFADRGQYLSVVAYVCGTKADPQNYDQQVKKLKDAGVILMPSNAQAVRFAMKVVRGL